jgi:histidine triad (HIT) family protein
VFCNIVNKILDKDILFEDDLVMVFKDIFPRAPVHLQIISKKHIENINHLESGQEKLLGDMVYTARSMAEKQGIEEKGYKLVFNVGRDGGQMIPHLHLHLLGGKNLGE